MSQSSSGFVSIFIPFILYDGLFGAFLGFFQYLFIQILGSMQNNNYCKWSFFTKHHQSSYKKP